MRGRRQSYQKSIGQSGDPPPPEENSTNAAQPRHWRRQREKAPAALLRKLYGSEGEQRQEKLAGEGKSVDGQQQA